MDFVELGRYFAPIEKDKENSIEVGQFWGPRFAGWLGWSDLLRHERVVVLAEALSGKTEEFRARAGELSAKGKLALLLTVQQLAEHGLLEWLNSSERDLFDAWSASDETAYFFIDSVDEARLNGLIFDSALRLFARDIGPWLSRARVFISCRVSDWRGDHDFRSIKDLLPSFADENRGGSPQIPDDVLLSPILEELIESDDAADKGDKAPASVLVARLVPLSPKNRRDLAAASGVKEPDKFVNAIDRAGLDVFADRPGDLLELAEAWKKTGEFGSFAAMTAHGVAQRIRETHPYRPDSAAIPAEKLRQGLERIAAVLTLSKTPVLRAPGQAPDPTLDESAIDPASVFDGDFNEAELTAILRRGVFAPATYGRIRFHHRSTQEYLTARWLYRLMINGCPLSAIQDLLYVDRYGVETVVPSLRPIAAWLALWQSDICLELSKRNPEVLLREGDPASLPREIRERFLINLARRHRRGEVSDDCFDTRDLWMFADPSLADAIREAWKINDTPRFRWTLLRLIREGAVADCMDLARKTAQRADEDDFNRIVAVEALGVCKNHETLRKISREIQGNVADLDESLVVGHAKVLFPDYMSVEQLLRLMSECREANRDSTADGFHLAVYKLWCACRGRKERFQFAGGLGNLCLQAPHVDSHERVSKRFAHLARRLEPIAREMAGSECPEAGDPPEALLRLLMVVERANRRTDWTDTEDNEDERPLADLVSSNRQLNHALFWEDVKYERERRGADRPLIGLWQFHFPGGALWRFSEADLPFLYEDLRSRNMSSEKIIAISLILNILGAEGRLDTEVDTLRHRISGDLALEQELEKYLRQKEENDWRREERVERDRAQRQDAERKRRVRESWILLRSELQADPSVLVRRDAIVDGSGLLGLINLTNWLRRKTQENKSYLAARQWRLLREGFGNDVATAYLEGMKSAWRVYMPAPPRRKRGGHTTVMWTSILAYAGLGLEAAEDPSWVKNLSEGEALNAAKHGCLSEEGYPEWIEALVAEGYPGVTDVVRGALKAEWKAKSLRPLNFLYRYRTTSSISVDEIARELIEVIGGPKPPLDSTLEVGLRILEGMELGVAGRKKLTSLAIRRFNKSLSTEDFEAGARYVAMVLILNIERGVEQLDEWISKIQQSGRVDRAEWVIGRLFCQHDPLIWDGLRRASAACLERLVSMAYHVVRREDDQIHGGVVSPSTRDQAEEARNRLLSSLIDHGGPEAYSAMLRLASDPALKVSANRLRELAQRIAEKDAEIPPWTVDEVLVLERKWLMPIKTGADLYRVVGAVLDDIRKGFETDDATSKRVLESAEDEEAVQGWLAEQLRLRGTGRFHVHRESEVANKKEPDVLISATSALCEVAIEVKHCGKRWTVRMLERALRKQLVEQYLLPEVRRYGFLLISHHRHRYWRHPESRRNMTFADVVAHLEEVAATITTNHSGSVGVAAVGIDATSRSIQGRGELLPGEKNGRS